MRLMTSGIMMLPRRSLSFEMIVTSEQNRVGAAKTKNPPTSGGFYWSGLWGLNPRPLAPQASALTN